MKILFLGFTSKKYDGHSIRIDRSDLTRKMSCMETWVPRIEKAGHEVIFFDGNNAEQSYDEKNKILHLISDESYDYNYLKDNGIGSLMYERLKEAVEWCLKNKEFDYIFRTDDGSYINSFVIDKMIADIEDSDVVHSHGGGGGVFMSRKVCEDLIHDINEENIFIEDVTLWKFFDKHPYKRKTSNLLCHQYIVSEDYFSIHYTNGKRQYFVDNVISYYYDNNPLKRKVILNYPLDHGTPLLVNTWDSDFVRTPIYYSMDKDMFNWEHYGTVARNHYAVTAECPFAKNSINELVFYNTIFDFNKEHEVHAFNKYLESVNDDGIIYFFYKSNNDIQKEIFNKLDIISQTEKIDIINEYVSVENGVFIKTSKKITKPVKMSNNKKIVLAQFWTNNLSYAKYTKAINEKYCNEKEYIYHIENDENKIRSAIGKRAFTWYKPILLLEVLEKYNPDYVLFLDADAIVVDNSYRIDDFIIEDKDIIVTEDYGPSSMNAGVILIKNTPWVKEYLQRWYDICDELEGGEPAVKGFYENGLWHDQTCFSYLLTKKDVKEKVKIISNGVLNSMYYKNTIKNFIFHAFAYGNYLNRTLDTAYFDIFNIPIPKGEQLLDIVQYYATDKHSGHRYFELIYNDLFRPLRESCKIFIEIGVYDCESIKLWRDYFINAEIVGIEYNLEYSLNKLGNTSTERLTFINADQSKEEDLISLSTRYPEVDIIMDDGSHVMRDQQITLAKLFKSVKPGGIYVLEDLHTSIEVMTKPNNWIDWGDATKTITLTMLQIFIKTGKIYSDYMSNEEMEYLNNNIESIEIYQSQPHWSITSIIKKKP
jgi:hypothetical protein